MRGLVLEPVVMPPDWVGRRAAGVSVGVYALAFVAPFNDRWLGGMALFAAGGVLCVAVPFSLPWWANALYRVALWHARAWRWGRAAAWAAPATVLAGAAPLVAPRVVSSPAFWLWVAAMLVLAAGGLAAFLVAAGERLAEADDEAE